MIGPETKMTQRSTFPPRILISMRMPMSIDTEVRRIAMP
jgi:hypothetical protein